jgi:hypothetical protein
MTIKELLEYASGGATSAGSIASSFAPIGKAPYNNVIRRMQQDGDYLMSGPSVPQEKTTNHKKRKKTT